MDEQKEELLEAGEAAKYLSDKWEMPYTTEAFKMLRTRWGLKPAFKAKNATFWRKSDLDKIPKPKAGRKSNQSSEKSGPNPGDTAVDRWYSPTAVAVSA